MKSDSRDVKAVDYDASFSCLQESEECEREGRFT